MHICLQYTGIDTQPSKLGTLKFDEQNHIHVQLRYINHDIKFKKWLLQDQQKVHVDCSVFRSE